MIQERLDALLRQLDPSRLEITNDSHLHGNPPESGTHFKVIMVSDRFSDLTRVKRHQLVYATCQELFQNPIHALALHLYSPAETQGMSTQPQSVACGGGDGQLK